MNAELIARSYFSAVNIPIVVLRGKELAYSSIGEALDYRPSRFPDITPTARNPEFCFTTSEFQFGRVQAEHTNEVLILGPLFGCALTENMIRLYMATYAVPAPFYDALAEHLLAAPRLTYMQFSQHLLFLHYLLNGKTLSLNEFWRAHGDFQGPARAGCEVLRADEAARRVREMHARLALCVRRGDAVGAQRALAASPDALTDGRAALTPLRHTKNACIYIACMLCAQSLIPSGVEEQEAYALAELYIERCERQTGMDAVLALQNCMLLDFCARAAKAAMPEGVSTEVCACARWIEARVSEGVTARAAAESAGRSVSYMEKKFKMELGVGIGGYIGRARLSRAKELLLHTDMSLAQISSFLMYASQSHFQNAFKREFGQTPRAFRRANGAGARM